MAVWLVLQFMTGLSSQWLLLALLTFSSTPPCASALLLWLPVPANIKPPELRRKAAVDMLIDKTALHEEWLLCSLSQVTSHRRLWTQSTQPCIPPGSLNRVSALAGGKGGILTTAQWQATLCDTIWPEKIYILCPSLRICGQLPAPIVNGEEDSSWKQPDFQLEGLVTLTLHQVILHIVVHHSSTSIYMPNFIEIEETFSGYTYIRMYIRMDRRSDIWDQLY